MNNVLCYNCFYVVFLNPAHMKFITVNLKYIVLYYFRLNHLSVINHFTNRNFNETKHQNFRYVLTASATSKINWILIYIFPFTEEFTCGGKTGYFADPKECTKYYWCIAGQKYHMPCAAGTHFENGGCVAGAC